MHIIKNWKDYFKNRHEGLGTTYERFVLHGYFAHLKEKYAFESVLEAPSFGMTGVSGINSLWWAKQGAGVTVVDDNQPRLNDIRAVWEELSLKGCFVCNRNAYSKLSETDKAFDLSWNFAALWFVPDLHAFLGELCRVTKKVIFICVPNTSNIFCALRTRGLRKEPGMYIDNIRPQAIKSSMKQFGWRLIDSGYFDVPPWPDIAMNKEELLKKLGLVKPGEKDADSRKICILDYFSGNNPGMEKEILRYGFLEDSFLLFKKLWAHHRYFVFIPEGKTQ